MSLTAFTHIVTGTAREQGISAGAKAAAREVWHAYRRAFINGEIAKRVKWYLPHADPVVSARTYRATIPAKNFAEFIQAEVFGEQALVHEFMRFVEPDDVFWDVGANTGIWSVLVGQAVAHTVAFEPDHRLQPYLQKNLDAAPIPSWRVSEFALGAIDGHEEKIEVNHRYGIEPVTLRIHRGDQLIEGNGVHPIPPPDVMKVDVEGFEYDVLRGMGDYLTGVRHILVEVHPGKLPEGVTPDGLEALLAETHDVQTVFVREGPQYHIEGRRSV